jgi:hypothetical protein
MSGASVDKGRAVEREKVKGLKMPACRKAEENKTDKEGKGTNSV